MTPLTETLIGFGASGLGLELAVKSTLVVLTGGLAALCLTRAPAAARHLAWSVTLAALLLLPALVAWAPSIQVPVSAAEAEAGPVADPAIPVPRATHSAHTAPASAGMTGLPVPAAGPAQGPAWSLPDATTLLVAVYLLGACGLLAFLAAGLFGVSRITREARPVEAETGWRELIASVSAAVGVRRPVSLRVSPRVSVPLAWGLRRPVVLLPSAAEGWDAAQRRDVLTHELAHVARGDWLSQLLGRVVQALYWFHPLVWIAVRRLVLEAERSCDDRVLRSGGESCDYAERLLRAAGAARLAREPSYAAVAMARRTDLATRVQAILDGRIRRGRMRVGPGLLLAGALLVPSILVGPTQLVRAASLPGVEWAALTVHADDEALEHLSPLVRAAHRGDLAEVRRLLDAGEDPNRVERLEDEWRAQVQRSALGGAVRFGHLEVVRTLLAAGADVDIQPRGDATPLMIAARYGSPDIVRLLLEHGADADRVVPGDGTPLIQAARSGEIEIARMLLAAGADPDTWVDGDESALYHAVNEGDRRMVGLLLENGADPDAAWPGDGNALIVAAREGWDNLVEVLLATGADPDQGAVGDGNALIRAAGEGDLRVVRHLLDAGADPDVAVEGDGSPLIRAAAEGHLEIARLLVESGADVDMVVPGDENPLIQAAANGDTRMVRFLLESGADPNVRVVVPPASGRRNGQASEIRTPLTSAQRDGHDAVARLLRDHGARE